MAKRVKELSYKRLDNGSYVFFGSFPWGAVHVGHDTFLKAARGFVRATWASWRVAKKIKNSENKGRGTWPAE